MCTQVQAVCREEMVHRKEEGGRVTHQSQSCPSIDFAVDDSIHLPPPIRSCCISYVDSDGCPLSFYDLCPL